MHQVKGSIFKNSSVVVESVDMFRAIKSDGSWHCHYNSSVEEMPLFAVNDKYHAQFSDGKHGDMIFKSIGNFRELNFVGIGTLT